MWECLFEAVYTHMLLHYVISETALMIKVSSDFEVQQRGAGQIGGLETVRKGLLVRNITSGALTSC